MMGMISLLQSTVKRFFLRDRGATVDKAPCGRIENAAALSHSPEFQCPPVHQRPVSANSVSDLPDMSELVALLQRIIDGLEHACNSCESDFLQLGDRLQTIYHEADQLTGTVIEVLSTDRPDSIGSALTTIQAHARQAVQELHQQRLTLSGDIHGLKRVHDNLARLSGYNQEFKQIAKNLKMVGLNIKIESARSEAAKITFLALAEEITALAQTTHSVAACIRDDTQAAQRTIDAIQGEIAERSQHLDGLLAAAESMVESAMREVDNLMQLTLAVLDGIGVQAAQIREQTGRLVVAIQIHDSIAQRTNHINASIAEARQVLQTLAGSEIDARLGRVYGIIRIQSTHLRTIVEDVAAVGGHSSAALAQLIIAVHTVSRTEALAGDAATRFDRPANRHPVTVLKKGLEQLLALFDQGLHSIGRLRDARDQTGRTVARMGQHIGKLGDINFDIHLKALNAVLKSNRLGRTGKAVEAVVHEMKALAAQSNATIRDVTGIMEQIASNEGADRHGDCETQEAHRSGRMLRQGIDAFSTACEVFDRRSRQALDDGNQIREKIEQSLQHVAFFHTMKTDFDRSLDELARVNDLLQPFAGTTRSEWVEEEKRILARYTMQRERETHRQTGKNVSLEKNDLEKNAASTDPGAPVEANVEFF
jgi:hypothetical protein